jgi:hypothetical protein
MGNSGIPLVVNLNTTELSNLIKNSNNNNNNNDVNPGQGGSSLQNRMYLPSDSGKPKRLHILI